MDCGTSHALPGEKTKADEGLGQKLSLAGKSSISQLGQLGSIKIHVL